MMKTDILFSSPCLRFSQAQQEAVLAWGKELGARNVPSLYKVDKFQKEALESLGDPMVKIQASSGNVFFMNSACEAIARDYAHPKTRPLIHAYPEFTKDVVTEVWQCGKWRIDAPDSVLTLMICCGMKDFYVNKLVQQEEGTWFIPTRFFEI
ncbi:hypothetical protein JAAARDRAFT_140020 [Jaapia argillacea MUCL 33604]|uniref:Uncharacterized protein n=1 Tax=Jaapia argillacea MUCL 33604 TaxID=933084 RepID=A0A067P9D3_9AGAM|nr:hypothetical protein JAAARDRAFT_140020 [Jaapia argillacea MUCL 33604]